MVLKPKSLLHPIFFFLFCLKETTHTPFHTGISNVSPSTYISCLPSFCKTSIFKILVKLLNVFVSISRIILRQRFWALVKKKSCGCFIEYTFIRYIFSGYIFHSILAFCCQYLFLFLINNAKNGQETHHQGETGMHHIYPALY